MTATSRRGIGFLAAAFLALVLPRTVSAQEVEPAADTTAAAPGTGTEAAPPAKTPPAAKNPRVSITVAVESEGGKRTPLGSLIVELYPEDAPKHVANFLKLVNDQFYQGLTFHRIVPAFIVQGGDPISRENWASNRVETGGPTEGIPAEIGRKHLRGAVAAARKPDAVNPSRDSSGSQFYICLADLPALDRGGYTVFGQVVEGMEVVDKIARVKNSGSTRNQALQRVLMTQVREIK